MFKRYAFAFFVMCALGMSGAARAEMGYGAWGGYGGFGGCAYPFYMPPSFNQTGMNVTYASGPGGGFVNETGFTRGFNPWTGPYNRGFSLTQQFQTPWSPWSPPIFSNSRQSVAYDSNAWNNSFQSSGASNFSSPWTGPVSNGYAVANAGGVAPTAFGPAYYQNNMSNGFNSSLFNNGFYATGNNLYASPMTGPVSSGYRVANNISNNFGLPGVITPGFGGGGFPPGAGIGGGGFPPGGGGIATPYGGGMAMGGGGMVAMGGGGGGMPPGGGMMAMGGGGGMGGGMPPGGGMMAMGGGGGMGGGMPPGGGMMGGGPNGGMMGGGGPNGMMAMNGGGPNGMAPGSMMGGGGMMGGGNQLAMNPAMMNGGMNGGMGAMGGMNGMNVGMGGMPPGAMGNMGGMGNGMQMNANSGVPFS